MTFRVHANNEEILVLAQHITVYLLLPLPGRDGKRRSERDGISGKSRDGNVGNVEICIHNNLEGFIESAKM